MPVDEFDAGHPGIFRYWYLEMKYKLGSDESKLLDELDQLAVGVTDVLPLFSALKAELLAAVGRLDEAANVVDAAMRQASAAQAEGVLIASHLSIVEERWRRLGP